MHQQVSQDALWKREFNETVADLDGGLGSRQAANVLRYVMAARLLHLDDIKNDPEKFFLAHRMLAKHVPRIGSNFWARFALQYNLFTGTVLALGSEHQVTEFLFRNGAHPSLGCFAMTEQRTGDRTGFLIETIAELSMDERSFVLHTPNDTAAKTWIAQGLVADQAIVIAKMIVHGHSYGPQAFLVDLRDHNGEVKRGITLLDMGIKEGYGGDMDNARITFDQVRIPLSAHLCRYMQVKNGTVRHPTGCKIRIMDIIGQRLFTARVLVAQGALAYTRVMVERASNRRDASSRVCWIPLKARVGPNTNNGNRGGPPPPLLSKGLLSWAFVTLDKVDNFCSKIEAELCQCLRNETTPKERLQQAIAVAKVEAVETSLHLCKQTQEEPAYREVGRDFLLYCQTSEGDTHVLIQKMARDLARTNGDGSNGQVKAALEELKQEMIQVQMGTKCKTMQAWDRCGELVYAVAEAHMNSILRSYGCLLREEVA